jgi:flagellar hook protein FlgE
MLRSLFSAISGMRVNQTMIDVTGNNVANVNTVGYKSSTTIFQDTLSQMLTASTGPQGGANGQGGTNPIQIGLGAQLAAVSSNMGQGSAQSTGVGTHMMIQGDGFFIVERGTEQLYTRAGAFQFDAAGNLVTSDGDRVQGYGNAGGTVTAPPAAVGNLNINDLVGDANLDPEDLQSYSIGTDGTITGIIAGDRVNLGRVAIADFVNPNGLEKAGDTMYRVSPNSGDPEVGNPGEAGRGSLLTGNLEMSNVDLAQEFTNLIIAQRGFQANSRVITTSDSVLEELVNLKR